MNTIKKTLFIGKALYEFAELPSTNAFATQLTAKNNPPEGTVITTYHQVQGKGQGGSYWESAPDKNISMTVILHPIFLPAKDQFHLNQAISLGVLDFVKKYISNGAKIKWSNDIYVGDKKIAGILIQNTLQAKNLQHSIIGIGININQTIFKSDAPNPTSLQLETERAFNLDECLEMLCKTVEVRYLQLKANAIEKIKADYLDNLYRYMEDAFYRLPHSEEVFQGRIIGIGSFGKLLLQTNRGVDKFNTKEVKFEI
ncbi:MAG: biotin--[acetyl-CoA-carboxylase] ligase [Bacteroidota bacterium]